MGYTRKKENSNIPEGKDPIRLAERWMRENIDTGFILQDWHFHLRGKMEPIAICMQLGHVDYDGIDTLTWPNEEHAKQWRDFMREHHGANLLKTLGVKKFLVEGENRDEIYLTKPEINLMFDLAKAAKAGAHVDSHSELYRFRQRQNVSHVTEL